MAVRIEQPQPFAPGVAFDYGAAEVQQRNNPVIAGGYSDAARLQASVSQANAERQARSQSRDLELAQRQTEADYRNAQQGLVADANVDLQREELQDRRQGRFDAFSAQAGRDQFLASVETAQIAKRAEAAAWVNQQEMTQADIMDLRKRERAVSEIANDRTIDDDLKADMILQLRTGISRDQQRLQASQARMLQQRAAQYESEVKLQSDVARKQGLLDAKTIPDRTEYMLDPAVQAQVEQELGPITAEEMQQHGQRAPLARRQKVAAEVAKRGGLLGYMVATGYDQQGKAQFAHQEFKKEAAADPIEQMGKALKVAEALAKAMHPPAIDGLTGKETLSPEYHKAVAQQLQTLTGGQGGQPAGGQAGEKKAAAQPYDPTDRSSMDSVQFDVTRQFDAKRVLWENRSDVPEADKIEALRMLHSAQGLLGAAGGYDRLEGPAKKLYEKFQAKYKAIEAKHPAPAPAAPAPAAPQPQSARPANRDQYMPAFAR